MPVVCGIRCYPVRFPAKGCGSFVLSGAGAILISFLLGGLLVLFAGAGILAVLPEGVLRRVEAWRSEILAALWVGIGALAITGAALRVEGVVNWCPVFGMDGPTLPMLVLLAFAGGVMSHGYRGLACVLTGLAFLALSPLVFGLLAGTALVLLAGRGRQGVCLPAAIIPACIPADSPLSPVLMCGMVLLLGWAVASQKGPEATVPAGIGLFLLGRLLSETGVLSPLPQMLLLGSGCFVALAGGVQALRAQQAVQVAAGLGCAGFGALVVLLTLALATTLEGMEQFRTATQLGVGAPFLALLALLWLCQPKEPRQPAPMPEGGVAPASASLVLPTHIASPAGLVVLCGALFGLSGLPPLGGFSVLWCLISAGELATLAAPPVQALGTVLVLVLATVFMALGVLGLIRLGFAALNMADTSKTQQNEQPEPGGGLFTVLPAAFCLGCGALVALLPGAWLALQDHLFVGEAAREFGWRYLLSIWFTDTPVSYTPLYSVLAVLLCAGAVIGAGMVLKLYPFPAPAGTRALWQEGAPLRQHNNSSPNHSEAGCAGTVQVWSMLGVFSGVSLYKPESWHGVEKIVLFSRAVRTVLLKAVAWCEAQGMVLILLFLGVGLLFGLFAGK